MQKILILILSSCVFTARSQTLGGNSVFNFLSQPNTAQLAALGAVNVSSIGNDVGMAFHNPALLRDGMDQQINTSFFTFAQGVHQYGLTTAFHVSGLHTNLGIGVQYLHYGSMVQTDASGNVLGEFRPVDYALQMILSKSYHDHWWAGITTKYVRSAYAQYISSGLAFDAGISYYDSEIGLQCSLLAKNLGSQFATYNGSPLKEEMPFDLQAGITKRLLNAPFQFSLTAHHLQAFNIYYNDSTFNQSEGDDRINSSTGQKILSHLVFSTEIFLSEQFQLTAGLNMLRRQSLNAYNLTSGLNGFNFGFSALFNKLQIRYATGFYQQNLYHQFTINLHLKGAALH